MADASVQSCQECGASVYPEHIQAKRAGVWGGKLYCIQCFMQHRSSQVTIDPTDFGGVATPTEVPISQPVDGDEIMEAEVVDDILADDQEAPTEIHESDGQEIQFSSITTRKIQPFSGTIPKQQEHTDERKYKRHLNRDGKGAVRCRIFHAKLSDGALKFMEDQINEWMDSNPDIEVKYTCSEVGIVEGKSAEPHLILTLFY